jgi:DNA topoisomerase-1
MDVVVVESPAKAQTINRYLGTGYKVLASYGHVRDLVDKEGSVDPGADFAMKWQLRDKRDSLGLIAKSLRNAKRLILATDPDREGEAISWHVREALEQRGALGGIDVQRVAFNEITRDAVREAMRQPRNIDRNLVHAYLARRALDYLVGFTLSPVLWRKLRGARSAGRVQSVALRLICEREAEIEVFRPREYWSIEADFLTPRGELFTARLTHLEARRLEKFDIGSQAEAEAAVQQIEAAAFAVSSVERREVRRHPWPPFNTSSLQQEASRKYGFGANRTMRTAQRLYEGVDIGGEAVGLITYMRTDSVSVAQQAIASARQLIAQTHGDRYVPEEPRVFKTKARNAQEAHEAIRPTDLFRTPDQVAPHLEDDQRKLYELIWKRMVASQMASAVLDQATVDLSSQSKLVQFRATGSVIKFDGFLKLYREDRDDPAEDESDETRILPAMDQGEAVERQAVRPAQHFTQPPPRYSEASLVKKLEELGIGRPSTYAQILTVLQDRGYVKIDKRRFVPEDRGRVVTSFLTEFFRRYVEYDFTADLEEQFDAISDGRLPYKRVLRDFWVAFRKAIEGAQKLSVSQVIDALDEALGPHFFPPREDGSDPRRCLSCGSGRLGLKVGKFGGFIGCSNYPECRYTRQLAIASEREDAAQPGESRTIGDDPETGQPIVLKEGPYGLYLQLGEKSGKEKPKRVSVPKGFDPMSIDLDTARRLLALPRTIGEHPVKGGPILAGIGRFGPYIQHGREYRRLPQPGDVLTIGLNHAVTLLEEPPKKGMRVRPPERVLGNDPNTGEPVSTGAGRFGPYVRRGKLFASLKKDQQQESLTLENALALLAEKAERAKPGKNAAAGGKPKQPRLKTVETAGQGEAAPKRAPRRKKTV